MGGGAETVGAVLNNAIDENVHLVLHFILFVTS